MGKRNRLTPEQRKALWKPTDANAGVGWTPSGHVVRGNDPDDMGLNILDDPEALVEEEEE